MLRAMSGSAQTAAATTRVSIDQIVLADEPGRWRSLGFAVEGDCVQLGSVFVRLVGDAARPASAPGVLEWSLRAIASTELDGLPTVRSATAPPPPAPAHPNGIDAIDHVVAMTPALDRSVRVLADAGVDLRRIREQPTPAGAPRQAFFRLGAEILELVQEPDELLAGRDEDDREHRARLWGLALLSGDFERTVATLGEDAGEPREAVQPGRRIVTVKRSAGLALPLAVMSARVPREPLTG
jgi:hypothetical protein